MELCIKYFGNKKPLGILWRWSFISNDSVAIAQKWFDRIKLKAKSLRSNPYRGRIVPELINATQFECRELIIGHYHLIYIIKGIHIFIIALIDWQSDLDKTKKKTPRL